MINFKNQKGMSLFEVILGVAVVGITGYVLATVETTIGKNIGNLREQGEYARGLMSMQADIMKEAQTLDSQAEPAEINTNSDIRAGLELTFSNATPVKVIKCYTYDISPVLCNDTSVKFRAAFYKYQVVNRAYAGNADLAKLPLSRVNTRIEYVNKKGETEVQFLSNLVAHTLAY